MTKQFDAITYAQELEGAGVPKAQAEVHAKALSYALSDSVVLPEQLTSVQQQLVTKIDGATHELDAKLDLKLDGLRRELEAKIELLRREMNQQIKYLKWMNGVTVALLVGLYLQNWPG